ncbi:MAG: OmpA family protein [Desulfovibrionaceae bacterium]|nr:OmpA family protein [Desulfovibrionaceae bacterium]
MKSGLRLSAFWVMLVCVTAGAGCSSSSHPGEVGFKPPSPQITPKPYLASSSGSMSGSLPEEAAAAAVFSGAAYGLRTPDLTGWTSRDFQDAVSVNAAKIYFYFDSAQLTNEAKEVLRQKAVRIRSNSRFYVVIAGHGDERGSDAYNLALGERRAQAAMRFLVSQGVAPASLGTISFGKRQPEVRGSDSEAMSLNRRAEFFVSERP